MLVPGAGPRCSTPGCGAAATLQWQRAGAPAELAAALEAAQARQDELWKTTRQHLTLDLLARRDQLDAVTARAQAGDPQAAAMVAVVAQQVADAEAALEGQAPPLVAVVDSVAVAVLGCDVHKVSLDAATVLHDADCTDGTKCAVQPAPKK